MENARQDARKITSDTHLERLRQAVSEAISRQEKEAASYFIENAIQDDLLLHEAKRP